MSLDPAHHTYHPFRVSLDSNALQALLDHGGTIFEGEPFLAGGRSGASEEDALALHGLMPFLERGAFEFAVSANSLREAADTRDRTYLRWAYEVLDYWEVSLAEGDTFEGWGARRAALLEQGGFGYLSRKDAFLVRDALLLECDTFLTIEKRLPRNADHLRRELGIVVLRPPDMWTLMRPLISGF